MIFNITLNVILLVVLYAYLFILSLRTNWLQKQTTIGGDLILIIYILAIVLVVLFFYNMFRVKFSAYQIVLYALASFFPIIYFLFLNIGHFVISHSELYP